MSRLLAAEHLAYEAAQRAAPWQKSAAVQAYAARGGAPNHRGVRGRYARDYQETPPLLKLRRPQFSPHRIFTPGTAVPECRLVQDSRPWPSSSHSPSICPARQRKYDLAASDAEAAEQEARHYLDRHQTIEVWSTDHLARMRSLTHSWEFASHGHHVRQVITRRDRDPGRPRSQWINLIMSGTEHNAYRLPDMNNRPNPFVPVIYSATSLLLIASGFALFLVR